MFCYTKKKPFILMWIYRVAHLFNEILKGRCLENMSGVGYSIPLKLINYGNV